jgi:hypothetical protein
MTSPSKIDRPTIEGVRGGTSAFQETDGDNEDRGRLGGSRQNPHCDVPQQTPLRVPGQLTLATRLATTRRRTLVVSPMMGLMVPNKIGINRGQAGMIADA